MERRCERCRDGPACFLLTMTPHQGIGADLVDVQAICMRCQDFILRKSETDPATGLRSLLRRELESGGASHTRSLEIIRLLTTGV